jgi:hypothetical protein
MTPLATDGGALDDAPVIPEVEGLAADERGLVLGLLLGLPPGGGAEAAAPLAGAAADRCRAALAAVRALGPEGEAAARAALGAEIAGGLLAGLALVHPGWVRRALEGERGDVIRAVVRGAPGEVARVAGELLAARDEPAGPPLDGPVAAELRRAVFAALAPMPGPAGPPRAAALCALTFTQLLEEIDRCGATALGLALAGAPAAVVARAAAAAGEPHAREVLAAARSGASTEARAAARALVASVPAGEAARGGVRAVGLRAVARDIAPEGEAALTAVAQRLPPVVGEALLACAAASEAP